MSTYENKDLFEKDDRTYFEQAKKHPKHIRGDQVPTGAQRDDHESHVNRIDPASDVRVGLTVRTPYVESVQAFDITPKELSRIDVDISSAACRYLRKTADSEAIIVASPTLSASSDEDGSGAISLGMNLLDVKKAKLIRASGDAKCRLQEASKKIESTLGLGVEATRFARANAKYSYIKVRLSQLLEIKNTARKLAKQGTITIQDSNMVTQRISELMAEMERFKAEADQRRDLPVLNIADVRSRHGALVEAANDLQNIERDIRTNDALELSVSAGYRYNNAFDNSLQLPEEDGTFARVTLGLRLGALSSRRMRLEEEAAGAKIDAMFEQNTGTIWKSGFTNRAIERMIADLQNSEGELTNALVATKSTISKLSLETRPDTTRAKLLAEVESIRIGSNRAAIRGAINQLKINRKNIRALSQ